MQRQNRFFPNRRMPFGGRGSSRNFGPLNAQVKLVSHQVNAVTPKRLSVNKQMLSVPNHNYQTKIKKVFRVFGGSVSLSTAPSLTTSQIRSAILQELGVSTVTGSSIIIGLHDIRIYGVNNTAGSVGIVLTAALFDIEETSSSTAQTALFEDNASTSGVAHIRAAYPVNNRPTFTAATAATIVVTTSVSATAFVTIDVDATVTITPNVVPSLAALENDDNVKFDATIPSSSIDTMNAKFSHICVHNE